MPPKRADSSETQKLYTVQVTLTFSFYLPQQQQQLKPYCYHHYYSLRKSVGPNSIRDPVTGFTCLHHAALNGHADCVRLILENGAKLNSVDYKGSSALHLAAWAGNLQVVRLLLNHRPVSPPDGASPSAAGSGLVVKQQLVDINLCNNDNQTPLSLAAQFGHNEVVAELLKHQANVHLRNLQYESPLELACLNGRLATVQLLLNSTPSLVAELRKSASTVMVRNVQYRNQQQQLHEQFVSTRPSSMAVGEPAGSGGHARRPSGGWSSLLRGRRDSGASQQQRSSPFQSPGKQSAGLNQIMRQATLDNSYIACMGQQQQTSEFCETLSDHSPLHYAVRRGHLDVVDVLLRSYRANILQITTLGGVLHEVALNNGKHCDVIGLLFGYISQLDQENRLDTLERLVNLRNAQNKTVFEVLNEINNRSAQEVKRLIYEYADQVQRSLPPIDKSMSNKYNRFASHQQQLMMTAQQMNDLKQIETFATIKRTSNRKQQQQAGWPPQQEPMMFDNNGSSYTTQTIDRRSARTRLIQVPHQQQQQQQPVVATTNNMQQQQQQQYLPQMTRSVSNLTQVPFQHQMMEQNDGAMDEDIMWRHWLARTGSSTNQDMMVDQERRQARRQRSKSRDFSSNLADAHELSRENYDNSSDSAHLVRSQTDCSHLMARHYGGSSSSRQLPAQATSAELSDRKMINRHYHVYEHEFYPPRILKQQQLHQASSGDSYCTQSLIGVGGSNVVGGRHPMVAVVPPLIGRNMADRSSTRSSQSSNGFRQQPQVDLVRTMDPMQQQQQQLRNNSRLSLNIDSISSSSSQIVEPQIQQQQQENTMAKQQQQQHFDRFVNRHSSSRKSTIPQAYSFDLNVNSSSMQQAANRCNSASDNEKLQELMDFQRRLVANQQHDQQLQQQQRHQNQLHSSHSLGSHLSEPHLFESTRNALVHDFNQMIGQELLANNQPINSAHEGQSILTGVMLDMDKYGDQLTVSGTRITIPPPAPSTLAAPLSRRSLTNAQDNSHFSSASSTCSSIHNQDRSPNFRSSNGSIKSHASSQLSTQQPKCERLTTSQRVLGTKHQAIIYDLPAGASGSGSDIDFSSNNLNQLQTNSSTRKQAETELVTSILTTRASPMTEPPKEKPPPPPPSAISTPLQVLASGSNAADNNSNSNSNLSSLSDSNNLLDCQGGLLKMTSLTSNSSSQSGGTKLASNRNATILTISNRDPDSGVCTSNSPASMSHDSEGCLTTDNKLEPNQSSSQLRMSARDRLTLNVSDGIRTPIMSPPSPNTAQLCIEEALMPLDKLNQLSCNQSTTTEVIPNPNLVHTVGRWLQADQNKTEADYENCIVLQEHLRKARCLELDTRSTSSTNEDFPLNHIDDVGEADYANSTATSISSSVADSFDRLESIAEVDDKLEDNIATNRREVKLEITVVGGENEQSDINDQVFYIDPSELKRIALDKNRQKFQSDAQTLTEEDLCATIDKKSGYIRFTLRKRKKDRDELTSDGPSNVTSNDKSEVIDELANAAESGTDRTQLTKKRTRLQTEEGCDIETPASGFEPSRLDFKFKQNKQNISKLNMWFSTNLIALAEYSNKFAANGFDNLNFMNHPKLVNDENLKKIGIEEESHRMLIVDRISNELPLVDFNILIKDNLPSMKGSILPIRAIYQIAQIDCCSPNIDYSLDFADLNYDSNLKKLCDILPIGYICRLIELCNNIRDRFAFTASSSIRNEPKETIRAQAVMTKQISADSSDMDLDASVASATSSSSKESIKSIVVVAAKQQVIPDVTKELTIELSTESISGDRTPTQEEDQIIEDQEKREPENKVSDHSSNMNTDMMNEKQPTATSKNLEQNAVESTNIVKNYNSSLVGEAARRLEVAVATNQSLTAIGSIKLKPVAAARRFQLDNDQMKLKDDQQSVPIKSVPKETTKLSADLEPKPGEPDKLKLISPIKPAMSVKQTVAIFGSPVKSLGRVNPTIRSNNMKQQQQNDEQRFVGRDVSSLKSKFDSRGNNEQANLQPRPAKPPPPAKPIKLAIRKFNNDTNNQQTVG